MPVKVRTHNTLFYFLYIEHAKENECSCFAFYKFAYCITQCVYYISMIVSADGRHVKYAFLARRADDQHYVHILSTGSTSHVRAVTLEKSQPSSPPNYHHLISRVCNVLRCPPVATSPLRFTQRTCVMRRG